MSDYNYVYDKRYSKTKAKADRKRVELKIPKCKFLSNRFVIKNVEVIK